MLRVYHSNRLEQLLDRLIDVTAEATHDPLAPEMIVAQSQGMARWLALSIAEKTGIAANIDFILPATFVWRTFKGQLPGLTDASAFDRRVLAWRLMALLPEALHKPSFEPLRNYLAGERPELRRWQLCRQIADVFDQYLIYRPDMLLQWEKGEGEEWQAQLWRALATMNDSPHRASLWEYFLALADRGSLNRESLPTRLIVFGIPTLPPAYFEVVRRVAELIEVHLFVLNPCLLYWGDIEDPRNIARLRKARGQIGGDDYYAVGNPLLAAFGRQGRDFIDMLQGVESEEEEMFDAPNSDTLLGALQADLLTLTDRTHPDADRVLLRDRDRSFQVHSCHSPMREVEVLHDQLLAFFDEDSTLRPQDVVVMTPTIEDYAPYIEAVFWPQREGSHIPFSIVDLARQNEHPLIQAFMQLIDTATGRFAASELLSLLETPAVLAHFGLSQEDYEAIRRWVSESGIRWGLNGASRSRLDLPEAEYNSWEFGFQRLFLGYALPPGEEMLFAGVLPYGHVEGQGAAALGRLRGFVERLASCSRRLDGSYTASEWVILLNELIEAFFVTETEGGYDAGLDASTEALQIVRESVAALGEEAERAGYTVPFGFDLMRDFLRGQLGETNAGSHFLSGRVTFCAMIPMRSVPFRVVCLLGVGDRAFPRSRRPVGFDKIAEKPRRGDRSRRDDDLYLFLEALLSARDVFYASYVGRNIRDNSLLLPSVLLSELLDYVAGASGCDKERVRARLVVEHSLQPFSSHYFDGGNPELFSYAGEWLTGVEARRGSRAGPAMFFPEPLSAPAVDVLELEKLIEFFRHPARVLLRERLGVRFPFADEVVHDSEPFSMDQRTTRKLKEELLNRALKGDDIAACETVIAASGEIPTGAFGQVSFRGQCDLVKSMAENIEELRGEALSPLEVDLHQNGVTIVGWLRRRTTKGLIHYRAARITPRDRLDVWIEHLALNAMAPADGERLSVHVGEDGIFTFQPVGDALEHLALLLKLYREGMRAPLPFMPASAMAYAELCGRGREKALDAARARWNGSEYQHGEGTDSYCAMAHRGAEPINDHFESIARAVFEPLLAHMKRADATA